MTDVQPGPILTGPLFHEPVRVETVAPAASGGFTLGVVGLTTERFYKVNLDPAQLAQLQVATAASDLAGHGALVRPGIQADAGSSKSPSFRRVRCREWLGEFIGHNHRATV